MHILKVTALIVGAAAAVGASAAYAFACLVMKPRPAAKDPEKHPLAVRDREEQP